MMDPYYQRMDKTPLFGVGKMYNEYNFEGFIKARKVVWTEHIARM